MTRPELLHARIASLFVGETAGDCLEALCLQFAACLVVAAEDMDEVEAAIVEMAARVGRYVHSCHVAGSCRGETVQ